MQQYTNAGIRCAYPMESISIIDKYMIMGKIVHDLPHYLFLVEEDGFGPSKL